MDLWVQSIGGANVSVHVMVNNGDETFTLDVDRVPERVHYNRPEEHWYFAGVHLADIDHDGDLDVLQGQSRDDEPSKRHQFNIVLVNDGTGHFPSRIELPHAGFYRGFTAVGEMTTFDVNDDGWLDILLNHSRNDLSTDAETGVLAFTGRYIQVLVNRRVPLPGGGVWFGDETDTWVKEQETTTPERYPNGETLSNGGALVMRDLDRDGCADLLMSDTWGPIRKESPIAYRNNGRGQFRPSPPERFWRDRNDVHFGYFAHVADVNGDGVTDFVVPLHIWGPDELSDTGDDFTLFMTLLNTTERDLVTGTAATTTPPERGWTHAHVCGHRADRDCPTHAGVDARYCHRMSTTKRPARPTEILLVAAARAHMEAGRWRTLVVAGIIGGVVASYTVYCS